MFPPVYYDFENEMEDRHYKNKCHTIDAHVQPHEALTEAAPGDSGRRLHHNDEQKQHENYVTVEA